MALKLQIGSDGKLRLKGGKLVVDDGTHPCCCGTTPPHTPTNCNDCSGCSGCDHITVTVQLRGASCAPAIVTVPMTRGFFTANCVWIPDSGYDSEHQGLNCIILTTPTNIGYGGTLPAGLYWELDICTTGIGCCGSWLRSMSSDCPDASGWTPSDNYTGPCNSIPFSGGNPCADISVLGITCSVAPPP